MAVGVVAQRGRHLGDRLGQWLAAAFEPRARMLRRRRRALRWGLLSGAGCLFWALGTWLLASWSTPVWVLIVTTALAATAAGPATLLLLRYRRLRTEPLPAPRPGAGRRLPPPDSAARPAMAALQAAERGLFSMLSVLERARLLPSVVIDDLSAVANQTAAAIAGTAEQVVSMERAVRQAPGSAGCLAPTIRAFTGQLDNGVRQYTAMVAAAAQLVAATEAGAAPTGYQRDELTRATDRLLGWAEAFDELGRAPRA